MDKINATINGNIWIPYNAVIIIIIIITIVLLCRSYVLFVGGSFL